MPMPSPEFAELVLPLPVDRSFTYRIPAALRARAVPGMRALVPVKNRIKTGYVVALAETSPVDAPKDLLDFPDEGPVFNPAMLELCRWMSDYYCCSWGEALQCALPAGMRVGSHVEYVLDVENMSSGRYTDLQRAVIAELYRRGPRSEKQLAAEIEGDGLSKALSALVRRGVLHAQAARGKQTVSIMTETYARLAEDHLLDTEALVQLQRRAPKQAAVYLDLLHGEAERAASYLYEKHKVNASVLAALEKKGLIARVQQEYYRAPAFSPDAHAGKKLALNPEQQAAYDALTTDLEAQRYQTYLLQGITGSGKTEVYLQVIERTIALGRDAIMLVPEISLTPQTVGRFYARFNQDIAVLHSGLSQGERYDEWRRAQRGEVRIVVGARSAVFAPLPDLGVIVVDEEHDSSYKQSDTPRYHARDAAIMRARMANAVCVLGSATPSVESFHNTTLGKSRRLELSRRATAASLPEIRLIDMRRESRESGGQLILSEPLESAVRARVAAREQVILLLNRRGHSPFVLCPQCGWVAGCENCQVSMTYHSKGSSLRCHYCNVERPKPETCDACYFNPLIYLGTGTQKAEDYLMRAFVGSRVERMDADTTSGKGGHAKILGRFAKGEIDILIGTQMLAKGHDYPGVTLVGVINADTGLSLPDFRAAESTFQLLTQVAGRAGRGGKPGEVLIQTFRPNHYAVQAALHHDFAAFYSQEMGYRKSAGYPPLRRMVNILIESEDPLLAEKASVMLRNAMRAEIQRLGFDGVEILGPSPAVVRRVKKKYRWCLAALSRSAVRLNTLSRAVRDSFQGQDAAGQVQLKIDLDPQNTF